MRGLLAMEAHTRGEEVAVSKQDVDRIEQAVRAGAGRKVVFPALSDVGSEVTGDGLVITVRITKAASAAPVRLVGANEDVAAGAIREVDLQRKYHWSKQVLATRLCLPTGKCAALSYLGIENDEACRHDFVFGSQVHRQYSDNALRKLREALDTGVDLDEVWRLYRRARTGSQANDVRSGGGDSLRARLAGYASGGDDRESAARV